MSGKPTGGESAVFHDEYYDVWSVEVADATVCNLFYIDEETHSRIPLQEADCEANANLIADAFNVHHETGLTPRQLADERESLLVKLGVCFGIADAGVPKFANGGAGTAGFLAAADQWGAAFRDLRTVYDDCIKSTPAEPTTESPNE